MDRILLHHHQHYLLTSIVPLPCQIWAVRTIWTWIWNVTVLSFDLLKCSVAVSDQAVCVAETHGPAGQEQPLKRKLQVLFRTTTLFDRCSCNVLPLANPRDRDETGLDATASSHHKCVSILGLATHYYQSVIPNQRS